LYRWFERRYYQFALLPKVTSKSARKMMTNNYLRPACADGDTDTQKSYQLPNQSALWGLDHTSARLETTFENLVMVPAAGSPPARKAPLLRARKISPARSSELYRP
jgi:hypothetical protein